MRQESPFYDDYEKAALWGKDLYEHLDRGTDSVPS
jgi:hypothetical protein